MAVLSRRGWKEEDVVAAVGPTASSDMVMMMSPPASISQTKAGPIHIQKYSCLKKPFEERVMYDLSKDKGVVLTQNFGPNAHEKKLYHKSGIKKRSSIFGLSMRSVPLQNAEEGVDHIKKVLNGIRSTLKADMGFEEVHVVTQGVGPTLDTCSKCTHSSVFVSKHYDECQRVVVIVPHREAGLWSYSMYLNGYQEAGSMLGYIRKALSENYGVIIMNPASQPCHWTRHIECAWKQLVEPIMADIFIIAYSRGCEFVKHLLNSDGGQGIMQERVRALALVEPSHDMESADSYFCRRFFSRRAIAWLLSTETPIGRRMTGESKKYGCVCLSAGLIPSSAHGSSGGWAMTNVMNSIFGTFAARYGKSSGVTRNDTKRVTCGVCSRKLGFLNRKFKCSWCELICCSHCTSEIFTKTCGMVHTCHVCQSLPCLIDPRVHGVGKCKDRFEHDQNHSRRSHFGLPSSASDVSLEDFEMIKLIGRGACGRVKLVRKKHGKDEGSFYAVKAIRKKLVMQKGLVNATIAERRILDQMNHPFITKLRYAFQTPEKLYLLTDYYCGGNLLDQMRQVRRFSEDRARLYAAEVALALDHLHKNHVLYRDLKLENVLCDEDGHIALTDFGMSKENVGEEGRATTFVGTFQMMAPELLMGKPYSRAVDFWALGVMVYEMIEGKTPFSGKQTSIIKERILTADLVFSSRFSSQAGAFVQALLVRNPADRLGSGSDEKDGSGFEAIKNHPWFVDLDWTKVLNKKAHFKDQHTVMQGYAKKFCENDVFDAYMNANEITVDTPTSMKSEASNNFDDFAYNYQEQDE